MPVTRLLRTEEDLASWVRRNPRVVDLSFAVLIVGLLAAMVLWQNFETVPYHVAFVSLAVVYGFRAWSVPVTAAALLAISATTGTDPRRALPHGAIDLEELSEIVLMPMILVAMAWHARRRDVMQRQVQAYADAERARWLREQEFLRDCSHALRTPLTVARGHVELIRDFRDPQEFESDVAIILGELDHLNRLASRLLAIADVERPDALHRQVLDLGQLVRNAATRWSASVDRRWECDVSEVSWVLADRERLESALDALVENAVKATGDAGLIRLACRPRGMQVEMTVSDDGPGHQRRGRRVRLRPLLEAAEPDR